MPVPDRKPQGVRSVAAVNPNLFLLAEQYLGDATQWDRIADLNGAPDAPPDFILPGAVTVAIPAKATPTALPAAAPSVEMILFGRDP